MGTNANVASTNGCLETRKPPGFAQNAKAPIGINPKGSNSMYTETIPWKNSKQPLNNNLHNMCSYLAMFPPALPNHFIRKYSSVGDVVLDPFSGRGTTILEACKLNRIGIGNDLNPLAFVLTKAKADVPEKGRIISRIKLLKDRFSISSVDVSTVDEDIKMLFSDPTLAQLIFLKKQLDWKHSKVDTFIVAILLGILHGKSNGYLSLSMPNTFSMSPNYIRKFVSEHGLERPERDVFELLSRKIERIYEKPPVKGKAYAQDTQSMSRIGDSSVDLIVTSPPYTRVITYGKYNWIRLWLLNKEAAQVDKKLFFSESIPKYVEFMNGALLEFKRVLKKNGIAVLVIGDVKHRQKDFDYNLAQIVWEHCAVPNGFILKEEIIEDSINSNSKVSKIWGKTKGRATEIDRIMVLQKP